MRIDPDTALLLLDDEWEGNALIEALAQCGIEAYAASSSSQALMALLSVHPVVAFVSAGNFATEGLNFLRVLRTQTGRAAGLPVIGFGALGGVPRFAQQEALGHGVIHEIPTVVNTEIVRWILGQVGVPVRDPLSSPAFPTPNPTVAPRILPPIPPPDPPRPEPRTPSGEARKPGLAEARRPGARHGSPNERGPRTPPPPAQSLNSGAPIKAVTIPPRGKHRPAAMRRDRRPPTLPVGPDQTHGPSVRTRINGMTRIFPVQSASSELLVLLGRGEPLPSDESLHLYYDGRLPVADSMRDVSLKILARVRSAVQEEGGFTTYTLQVLAAKPPEDYRALIRRVVALRH